MAIFWATLHHNPRQGRAGIWGWGTSSVASCWPSASRQGTSWRSFSSSLRLASWDEDSCAKKLTLYGHPWGPGTCTGPCTHGLAPARWVQPLSERKKVFPVTREQAQASYTVGWDLNPHLSHSKDTLFFVSSPDLGCRGCFDHASPFMAPRIIGSHGATHPALPPIGNCSFVCDSDPICPCSYITCLLRVLAF